jgi:hypothetical protein
MPEVEVYVLFTTVPWEVNEPLVGSVKAELPSFLT